jgi:Zn finger protein HypA/HybF involved in hydrogenase expression
VYASELTAVDEEALRFCFEAIARETDLESLNLGVEICPRRHRCLACRREFTVADCDFRCPQCASPETQCCGGDELELGYAAVTLLRERKRRVEKAPVPMHPLLAGFLLAWRERTKYAKESDYVFPSVKLRGKKPLSASIMVQKYLRPAAISAGVIAANWKGRFGFHNFGHSLAAALVKLKVDPKTVLGVLRHEDFGTTMELYAQSDMESMREAQGEFLEQLMEDRIHLLTERVQ